MTVSCFMGSTTSAYAVDEPIVSENTNLETENIDNDGKFKIALLPDTQVYANHYPEIFNDQTQWLADNFVKDDIKFTMHLGDLVDGGSEAEWKNATDSMDILDNNKVPYGATIGNHDLSNDRQDFVKYFGKTRAQDNPGYIEQSNNQLNSAYTFEAEGHNFLVVFLNLDATNDDLAWAQSVVDKHPNYPTICVTHTLIGPEGDMATKPYTYKGVENNSPEQVWNKFISKNNQIFMTVNGHDQGANNIVRNNDDGLEVYQYLVDYQGGTKGGNGFLRLIELDLNDSRINHTSYSPTINDFKTDGKNNFSEICEFDRRFNNQQKSYENGELIHPVVAGYSSYEERWGARSARQLVDGSGIIGYKDQSEVTVNSVHSHDTYMSAADAMWNSEYLGVKSTSTFEGDKSKVIPISSREEWIAFDLGTNTTLTDLLLWQYGEGREGEQIENMGAKDIEVSYSADSSFSSANFTVLKTITLDKHEPGKALLAQIKSVPKTENVRFVKLKFLSNYGDKRSVGLSEVRFMGSNEPLLQSTGKDDTTISTTIKPTDYTVLDETFTVEKSDSATPNGWAYYMGQSITPSEQGILGSGTIPSDTKFAKLNSFEVYVYTPDNIPQEVYIYDIKDVPADSDTFKEQDYSFTMNDGSTNNYSVKPIGKGVYTPELSEDYTYGTSGVGKKAVYTFENQILDVNKEVMLVFDRPTGLRYWQSTEYEGGYAIWTNGNIDTGNYRILPFKTDIDFKASFSPVSQQVVVPATPAAPVLKIQDTVKNTFGWTIVDGFTNLTDYEFSLDAGKTYNEATANPIKLPNKVFEIGSIKVRVKKDTKTGRPAGEVLSSTVKFTGHKLKGKLLKALEKAIQKTKKGL